MNKFITALSDISPNNFGFYCGGEYIVCVAGYLRTSPTDKETAYVDGYYEISNSQYHKAQAFIAFCKSCGCAIEIEREKSYKDFLFDNGFFGRGKNSLLYDKEFGSKIYFTVLKVAKMAENRETRLEFVKFLQILKSKQSRYKSTDDTCGNCTLCVSACPQQALPNELSNCLRAHMQEGRIEKSFSEKLGSRVLGCEICSEICPKNRNVAKAESCDVSLAQFLALVEKKDAGLCRKYGKNIIAKNKLIPYIINAMGNSQNEKYLPILEKYMQSENKKVKNSAIIAGDKLKSSIENIPNGGENE